MVGRMEPDRLARLLDRHAGPLALYARQFCDAPEDVVQDAFVKLASRRSPPDDPSAWLFRVVRNAAINAATAARRRHRHESAAGSEAPAWFDPDPSAAIDAESAEAALRTLPIGQREAIVARLWGGLTFEQIAALSGRSTSAVHRDYQSGLTTLRQRLGAPCRIGKSRPNES